MASVLFCLCLPHFLVKRFRKWSKLEEELFEEETDAVNKEPAVAPSWNNLEEGITEKVVATVKPQIESRADGGELSASASPSSTRGPQLDEVCVESVPVAVNDGTVMGINDKQVPMDLEHMILEISPLAPPSPFTQGQPDVEVPTVPPFRPPRSFNPESSENRSSPPLENNKWKCVKKIPLNVTPGAHASRQTANNFIPYQSSITRTMSAPATPSPSESRDLDEQENSRNSDVEANGNVQKEEEEGEEEKDGRASGLCVSGAVAVDKGPRRTMEDKYFITTDVNNSLHAVCPSIHAIAGVFDGHNGSEAAEFASQNFLRLLVDVCKGHLSDISSMLTSTFLQCEHSLYKQWIAGVLGDSGTTALVVVVSDTCAYIANAGDCRAVLSRAGRAEALTKDHRPGSPRERARILDHGGFFGLRRLS